MVIVSVVPIFSKRLPNHKQTRKSIIESIEYGRNFTERCIHISSTSGIDVDLDKLGSLYESYDDCASEVGDYEQFFRDAWEILTYFWKVRSGSTLHLSDNQKTEIVVFLQKLVYQ